MATLPIYLEVEDVAVGPVLIALRKMPGIIKMNLDIGAGAPQPAIAQQRVANGQELVVALLIKHHGEAMSLDDLSQNTGLRKGSLYGALNQLKGKKVVHRTGPGSWGFTDKAKRELVGGNPKHELVGGNPAMKLLAAPRAKTNGHGHGQGTIARGPSGRASTGAGRKLLLHALVAGGVTRADLGKHLAAKGMSEKSLSGIFDRAKRDELIKKVGDHYELTVAGKREAAADTAAAAPTGE